MSIPEETPSPRESASSIVARRKDKVENSPMGLSDGKKNTEAVWETLKDLAYKIDHPSSDRT